MKRKDFIKIIRLRSCWTISKRKGNYRLPGGQLLSKYIAGLVDSQMYIDELGIDSSGNLSFCSGGENLDPPEYDCICLMPDFKDIEICSYDEMQKRIDKLVRDIIYFQKEG